MKFIRKMKHKKGFVKTVEVMIAVLMSFVFLIVLMPTDQQVSQKISLGILSSFGDDDLFRNCVTDDNVGCIDDLVSPQIPPYLEYELLITSSVNEQPSLPEKKVFVETYYIVGNITEYDPKIVKLFYWERG